MTAVIKLRGLPYDIKERQIADFFQPLAVGAESVTIVNNADGRPSGQAFVWLHQENERDALKKNKEYLGSRYVDIFPSDENEYTEAVKQMQRGGGPVSAKSAMKPIAAPRVGGGRAIGGGGGGAGGRDNGRYDFRAGGGGGPRDNSCYDFRDKGNCRFAADCKFTHDRGFGRGGGKPNTPNPIFRQIPTECVDGVLRLRGLPFDCEPHHIAELYPEVTIDESGVYFKIHTFGPRVNAPKGDAYVRFDSPETATRVVEEMNKRTIGDRYVEVFRASEDELSASAAEGGIVGYENNNTEGAGGFGGPQKGRDVNPQSNTPGAGWLKLRGLPWSATAEDVVEFFLEGKFEISVNEVTLKRGSDGRATGDAFVQVDSPETAELCRDALDKQHIGDRYVDAFVCDYKETQVIRHNRPGPYSDAPQGPSRRGPDLRGERLAPYIVTAPGK